VSKVWEERMSSTDLIRSKDAKNAGRFLGDVKRFIQAEGGSHLLELDYEDPSDLIKKTDTRLKTQSNRITTYEKLVRDLGEVEKQIEGLLLDVPGNQLNVERNRIEKDMNDMNWRNDLELTKERELRKDLDIAERKLDRDKAIAQKATNYVTERVVDAIRIKLNRELESLTGNPKQKVMKLLDVIRKETAGDQGAYRKVLEKEIETMKEAKNDQEVKGSLERVKELIEKYQESRDFDLTKGEVDREMVMETIENITRGGGVSLELRLLVQQNRVSMTHEELTEMILSETDRLEQIKTRTSGEKKVDYFEQNRIDNQQSVFAMSARSGGQMQRSICYNFSQSGTCRFGDKCRYVHNSASQKQSNQQHFNTRDQSREQRERSRERGPIGSVTHNRGSGSPNRGGGSGRDQRGGESDRGGGYVRYNNENRSGASNSSNTRYDSGHGGDRGRSRSGSPNVSGQRSRGQSQGSTPPQSNARPGTPMKQRGEHEKGDGGSDRKNYDKK
jgi:hypothetical protein